MMMKGIRIWLRALVWAVRHAGNYGTTASKRETAANTFIGLHLCTAFVLLALTELMFDYKGLLSLFRGRGVDLLFWPFLSLAIFLIKRYSYDTPTLRKEHVGMNRLAVQRGKEMSGIFWKILIFLFSFALLAVMFVLAIRTYPTPVRH
jgi:hypothetical protein